MIAFWNKSPKLKQAGSSGEIISIDAHTDYLKVVRAGKLRDKIIIRQFGHKRLFSQEKTYAHFADKLRELLRECGVEEKRIKKSNMQLILSGSEVCVRVIKLPVMPKEEVAQAVKAKIKEVVSYPLEEMVFDFSILGESQERGANKFDIVFIAIQKNILFQYLDIFRAIGAEPRLVTSTCFCEWNLIKALGEEYFSLSVITISTGYTDTDISVFKEGKLIFTRNIPFGERDFIEALKHELNIAWEEAEEIKREYGLSGEISSEKYQFSSAQIQAIMEKQADILFKEIDLTSHHYYQITHGGGVDKYILLGSVTQIKGLKEFLFHRLDMPVEEISIPEEIFQAEADIQENFRKQASFYHQNLGGMLAYPGNINLVSFGQKKTKYKIPLFKFRPAPELNLTNYIIFGALSLVIIIFAFLKIQNIYYTNQIKANKVKCEQLQDRLYKALRLNRELEYLEVKKGLYAQLQGKNIFYPQIIFEIYKAIPEGKIFLEQIQISSQPGTENAVTITGLVHDPDYSATAFMLALEKSGYFEGLSLNTNPARREMTGLGFVIRGKLRNKK